MKIYIKKLNENIKLPEVIAKGEWVDLTAAKTVQMRAPQAKTLKKHTIDGERINLRDVTFDTTLIPLGVAMKLPEGFEAIVAPRSSTLKHFGIVQTNSIGVIDNSYNGNKDEWMYPALSLRNTKIAEGSRICQFRIQLSQNATMWQKLKWLFSSKIKFVEVFNLDNESRGGFGTTGE